MAAAGTVTERLPGPLVLSGGSGREDGGGGGGFGRGLVLLGGRRWPRVGLRSAGPLRVGAAAGRLPALRRRRALQPLLPPGS